jgi:hypothetical protein
MMGVKVWNVGNADEVWKLFICARDSKRAEDLITGVAAILDNPGNVSVEKSADVLRQFSGDQIADALLKYRQVSMQSVFAARNEGAKP